MDLVLAFTIILYGIFYCVESLTIDQILQNSFNGSDAFLRTAGGLVRVELDMLLDRSQWLQLQPRNKRQKRKALKNFTKRWTNGVIPFTIDIRDYQPYEVIEIIKATEHWNQHTCLNFRWATSSDRNKVKIQDGPMCGAQVGMVGGEQALYLGRGCGHKSVVVHELGHVIGFHHEHSRPDRDQYVTIHLNNVIGGEEKNFDLYPRVVDTYNVTYDYTSIMHYGKMYFSKNNRPTIMPKDRNMVDVIGTAEGLSFNDIKLAHIMYNCAGHCVKPRVCPGRGFLGKDCRCWFPGGPISYIDPSSDAEILKRNINELKDMMGRRTNGRAVGYSGYMVQPPASSVGFTESSQFCLRMNQLERPLQDLNVSGDGLMMEALHDGGALVLQPGNNNYTVVRINQRGSVMSTVFTTSRTQRLKCIIPGPTGTIFTLHDTGVIKQIVLESGQTLQTWQVSGVELMGAGDLIGQGQFLLLEISKKELFVFDTKMNQRKPGTVLASTTNNVVSMVDDRGRIFLLCDGRRSRVLILNESWKLVRVIGDKGSADSQLKYPIYVIVSPFGSIWVADRDNNKISEFTTRGRFVRHVVPVISRPLFISFAYPFLWVMHQGEIQVGTRVQVKTMVKRYKIFKE